MMPEMDGLDAGRADPRRARAIAGVPVLLLTSAGGPEDARRCRDLRIAACLTKPVRQSELFDALMKALSRPRPCRGRAGDAARGRATSPRRPSPPDGRRLRVLLAEDHPVNQKVAVRMLERLGHSVVVAPDGRAGARRRIDDRARFDVVLMDVQMPEMDGFEAVRAIRAARGRRPGGTLPIIALTAHAMKGDRERCLAAGFDGYLAKPIRQADLEAALEALATRRAAPTATPQRPGPEPEPPPRLLAGLIERLRRRRRVRPRAGRLVPRIGAPMPRRHRRGHASRPTIGAAGRRGPRPQGDQPDHRRRRPGRRLPALEDCGASRRPRRGRDAGRAGRATPGTACGPRSNISSTPRSHHEDPDRRRPADVRPVPAAHPREDGARGRRRARRRGGLADDPRRRRPAADLRLDDARTSTAWSSAGASAPPSGDRYIYIILLTSLDRREDRLKGLRAGADDFLTKPPDPDELAVRLEIAERILAVHDQLARQNARLAELASTDELTGVKNRRRFREDLELLFAQADRQRLAPVADHARHRPLQAVQRHLRPPGRRPGPPARSADAPRRSSAATTSWPDTAARSSSSCCRRPTGRGHGRGRAAAHRPSPTTPGPTARSPPASGVATSGPETPDAATLVGPRRPRPLSLQADRTEPEHPSCERPVVRRRRSVVGVGGSYASGNHACARTGSRIPDGERLLTGPLSTGRCGH